jgi:hypothetical protein
VEGAEESLSILPDYTPTVRPPPSAHDHVDRDMLQRLTCSRTATVVWVWCPMCTIGSMRTERRWVAAVNGVPQRLDLGGKTVQ